MSTAREVIGRSDEKHRNCGRYLQFVTLRSQTIHGYNNTGLFFVIISYAHIRPATLPSFPLSFTASP